MSKRGQVNLENYGQEKVTIEQIQYGRLSRYKKTAQYKNGHLPSNPHHPAFYTTLRCDAQIIVTTYTK
ncbi:hypothetical protein SynPROS91_01712 [Synechococcus sp. PROS-9-1]|nr:hypothetical protein SynPROS91_01712 [Synechococcus sp. PROS-9-1]